MSDHSTKSAEVEMTVLDRVLCAFGFHARLRDTGMRIVTTDTPTQTTIGAVLECSKCGRRHKEYVY